MAHNSRPRALSFSGYEGLMESYEPARARSASPAFGEPEPILPDSPVSVSSFESALESLGDADLEPQMRAPIITQKMGIRWGDNDDEVADFIRANEKKKALEASDDHHDQVSLSPEQLGSKKSPFDADHDDQVSLSSEKPGSEAVTDNKTESDVDMEDQWKALNDRDIPDQSDVDSAPDGQDSPDDTTEDAWANVGDDGAWPSGNKKKEIEYTHDIDLEHVWDPAEGNSSIPNFRHVPINQTGVAETENQDAKEPVALPTAETSSVGTLNPATGQKVSEPNKTDLKSMVIRCLLGTPGKIVGYAGTASKYMKKSDNPSTTTHLKLVRSQTFPARIEMSHAYTHSGHTVVFARSIISLEQLESCPEVAEFKADDPQLKAILEDMHCADVPQCLVLTFHVIPQCKPWRQAADFPDHPSPTALLTEWLGNVMDAKKFIVVFPKEQMILSKYFNLMRRDWDDYQSDPTQLFANAKLWFQNPSNPKQLGWKTISVGNQRFRHPEPAMSTFQDDLSRMLVMQGSSYEELELELSNSVELEQIQFKILMLPDRSSEWTDEDSGIKPDNSTQRFLGVISIVEDKHRKYIAEVGAKFDLRVHEIDDFLPREQPADIDDNHPTQRRAIRHLMTTAQSIWAKTDIDDELDEDQTRIEREAQMTAAITSTFPDNLPQECRKDLPNEISNDDVKVLIASMLIDQFLPPRTHERTWENEALEVLLPYKVQPPTDDGPREWHAVRIKPPADCDPTAIYFAMQVPKEKYWPPRFAAPPVKIHNLVTPDMRVGSLSRIISVAGNEFDRTVTMKNTPNDYTTKREMAAVSTMATAADTTIQGRIWAYAKEFDQSNVQKIDLTKAFPKIRTTQVLSHQERLRDQLREVPAGLFLYQGGPGSGKSTFGVKIIEAMLHQPNRKAAWGAFSNELCKDAVKKLRAVFGKKKLIAVRIHPIRPTTRALTGRSDPKKASKETLRNDLSPGETAIQGAMHNMREESDQEHPMNDNTSIVPLAMAIAESQPEEWEVFLQLRKRDDLSKDDVDGLTKEAYRLLAFTMTRVSVIVGTPVALSDFARCSKIEQDDAGPWNPDAVFIDEVGRMAEAQFYMCFGWFNPKVVMATGDVKQFSPMSMSFAQHETRAAKRPTPTIDNETADNETAETATAETATAENATAENATVESETAENEASTTEHEIPWHATFGLQRKRSILARASSVNATQMTLVVNMRNHGSIGNWPARHIYKGHMDLQKSDSELGKLFRKEVGHVLRIRDSLSNSFIVNISEGEEERIGTSIANRANLNYVFYLIFRLFGQGFPSCFNPDEQGTLMIITPYSAQATEYIREWSKCNANDSMRSKVTFKTVDDSMSAEADIVIYDTVRTDKMGFVPDAERMAVATTRARGANITILRKDEWAKKSIADSGKVNHMVSYFNWHVSQNSVGDTRAGKTGWRVVCEKCNGPDHFEYNCPRTDVRPCRLCHRKDQIHHPRFCKRPFTTSDVYTKPEKREADRKAAEKEKADKDAEEARKAEKDAEKLTANTIAPATVKIKAGVPRSRKAIMNKAIDEDVVADKNATSSNDRARLSNAQTALRNINPDHGHLSLPKFTAKGVLAPAGVILGTSLESDPDPKDDTYNSDNDSQAEDHDAQKW
ncbi:hypothetical protein K4K56_005220 [Colletotrichum sp. SAR 10_98]|nr:hypothetical protein K4K56_005220 [Colletotrichum sp. SAR 10_98]